MTSSSRNTTAALVAIAAITAIAGTTRGEAAPRPAPRPAPPPAFAICGACHVTAAGQPPLSAPNLWQVGGRRVASAPDFAYSTAMRGEHFVWDRAHLVAFIRNPQAVVPGTRMGYAGARDAREAMAIADYLLTLR